jgi:hypothetical protein
MADALMIGDAERARVIVRAGALRRDGRPPRAARLDRDPQVFLRRGIGFAVASVVLLLTGLMMLGG